MFRGARQIEYAPVEHISHRTMYSSVLSPLFFFYFLIFSLLDQVVNASSLTRKEFVSLLMVLLILYFRTRRISLSEEET